MDIKFQILKDASKTDWVYNFHKIRSGLGAKERDKYFGVIEELKNQGFITQIRNSLNYSVTSLGKKVVELGDFEAYENKKSKDPSIQIISETLKEIASLNSKYADIKEDSIQIQKSANIFTVVTAVLLLVQTIFVALEYIYPPRQSLDTTPREQAPQNKGSKSSLKELKDSLLMEPQKQSKKTDSTSTYSLENK
jgi:hypothetical protein